MNFSKAIFKKEIYEISLEEIITFFSVEREETAYLEFKSGGVEIDHICSEICAFLNTEGGLLIIGAPKEKRTSNKDKTVCIGDLIPSKIFKNKDILLSKVTSRISPPPNNIKIQELEYSGGKVFIIEVAQSLTPPHQFNSEGKYYIRLEGEAKPAPHGLVEALFFKRQRPDLNAEILIKRIFDNVTVDLDFYTESPLTIEKMGYVLTINGIEQYTYKHDQIQSSATNERTVITCHSADIVLIKGLNSQFTFTFKPNKKNLLIDLIFWCKDADRTKNICFIYDFEKKLVIEKYSTQNQYIEENNTNEKERIISIYKELVK